MVSVNPGSMLTPSALENVCQSFSAGRRSPYRHNAQTSRAEL